MLSEEMRQLFRAAAWALIAVGVIVAVYSGLRQLGIMGPPAIAVNGNVVTALLGVIVSASAAFVQGGVILALLSIDERLQNKAS